MSKSKHTPGPWIVGDDYGNFQVEIEAPHAYRPSPGTVAVVWTRRGPEYATARQQFTDVPELVANARLIAAAPELLAALRDVVGANQTMLDIMPIAWQTFDHIARSAIERATGEDFLATPAPKTAIAKAADMGRIDGATMAREGIADGSYSDKDAKGFDDALLSAITTKDAAELFGCEVDTAEFSACLEAYEAAAGKAWREAAPADSPPPRLGDPKGSEPPADKTAESTATLVAMLEEYRLDYSHSELFRMATATSQCGAIDPFAAKRELRRRAVIAAATGKK